MPSPKEEAIQRILNATDQEAREVLDFLKSKEKRGPFARAEIQPLILEMARAAQDDTPLFNSLLGVLETIDPEVDWLDVIEEGKG